MLTSNYNLKYFSKNMSIEVGLCDIIVEGNVLTSNFKSSVNRNRIIDSFRIINPENYERRIIAEDKSSVPNNTQESSSLSEIEKKIQEEKLVNKTDDKTINKTDDKIINKTDDKTINKTEEKSINKTEEKPLNETKNKSEEKSADYSNNKSEENSSEESKNKSEENNSKSGNLKDNEVHTVVHGHERHEDRDAKQNNEFEVEDSLARNAFYLTIIFLSIFVCLFIYNIVRCYTRSTVSPSERSSQQGQYSKDLQHSTNPEDTTLDLTS